MAKKLNATPIILIIVLLVVVAGGYFFLRKPETNYYDFAECLSETGATKYGTESCLHCQNQKRIIGRDAFKQYFTETGLYVQCDLTKPIGAAASLISVDKEFDFDETTPQVTICNEVGVPGTPLWIINGERYLGEQSIQALADASGCPLPAEYTGETVEAGGFTEK